MNPRDPQYEAAKNNVLQLEYSIAESKSDLAYRQGKITDLERAQFFLDWSKKVPKDSELYRTLQKNAAQFIERSKAVGAAGASKAAAEARAKADAADIADYESPANYLEDMLLKAAIQTGAIKTPADGSKPSLTQLSLSGAKGGPLVVPQLLALLNNSPDVIAELKKRDPSFNGTQITQAYLEQVTARRQKGIDRRYNRAKSEGDTTGPNGTVALDKLMTDKGEIAREIGAYDTAQAYEAARNQWLTVWQDPNAGPDAKLNAWAKYRDTLNKLASDPETDAITKNALLSEADGDVTVDTLHENFTRTTNPTAPKASDTAKTVAALKQQQLASEGVANGTLVLTYGTQTENSDGTVTFKADPGGNVIGTVQVGAAESHNAEAVPVTQPDGTVITVYLKPVPVQVVARDANGNAIDPVDAKGNAIGNTVAQAYVFTSGGKTITVYKYQKPAYTDYAGVQHPAESGYTTATPWASGATVTKFNDRIEVDVSGIVQGDPTKIVTQPNTNGTRTVKGFNVDTAWSPIKNTAGRNYNTDTDTLIAAVMASLPPAEAKTVADAIKSDPNWTAILTPIIWKDGVYNPNAGAEIANAIANASAGKPLPMDPSGFLPYDNTTNSSTYYIPPPPEVKTPTSYAEYVQQQVDAANGTGFSEITKVMSVPGRLRGIDQREADTGSSVQIKGAGQLTLPTLPPLNPVAPAPYAGPAPVLAPPAEPWVAPLPQNVSPFTEPSAPPPETPQVDLATYIKSPNPVAL